MYFYSNFDRESLLDAELNFTSNEYPLGIFFTGPATPKTRNTWKNVIIPFFQVFLIFGVARSAKSMSSGYSLDEKFNYASMSSLDQNLSKNIGRYVENTNKKVGFFIFFLQN